MNHTFVHFEIPADDVQRARQFYAGVFGWDISLMPGPYEYYGVRTTETGEMGLPRSYGVNGGMYKRMYPNQVPISYIGVEDIDAFAAKVVESGSEITVPRMAVPGLGWMVHFKDPENNLFALWQGDREAA
jgi:predicted enzyme related to lactoylglutathione lyase